MSAPAKKEFLRAGELARAAGVSTDTLRHYEGKGVLAAPRAAGEGCGVGLADGVCGLFVPAAGRRVCAATAQASAGVRSIA